MLWFVIGFVISIFLITHFLPSLRYPMIATKAANGDTYIVRDLKDRQEAANQLGKLKDDCFRFRDIVYKKHQSDERAVRLYQNLREDHTIFSESTPDSNFTSHTKNKGDAIIFCLRQRNEKEELVDYNTLMFVAIHELGHVCSKTVGHNTEFWTNFRWLLGIAEQEGFYKPVDYSKIPQEYCGMMITDNPAID
jgi:predicted metal-dependent hydrolase